MPIQPTTPPAIDRENMFENAATVADRKDPAFSADTKPVEPSG
jgi:hypothetical protein